MEHKILVVYVGISGIRTEDVDTFIHHVTSKIIPTTFEGEIIIIPAQQLDTRIVCINPKYITEPELIQEHTELMKELQDALHEQLKIIKEEKHE